MVLRNRRTFANSYRLSSTAFRRRDTGTGVTCLVGVQTGRFGCGVLPPLACGLARLRDHRGNEDQVRHRDPRWHKCSGERAEGLTNHHEIAVAADGCRHRVGVIDRGSALVMKGKRRGHCFMSEVGERGDVAPKTRGS